MCIRDRSSLSNEISPPSENTIVRVDTDWGEVPVTISHLQEGMVAVVDRHHSIGEKRTPPHMIEHRANVMAVRSLNPDLVVSINSVGSMRDDFPPGKIGITSDISIWLSNHGHFMTITLSILIGPHHSIQMPCRFVQNHFPKIKEKPHRESLLPNV